MKCCRYPWAPFRILCRRLVPRWIPYTFPLSLFHIMTCSYQSIISLSWWTPLKNTLEIGPKYVDVPFLFPHVNVQYPAFHEWQQDGWQQGWLGGWRKPPGWITLLARPLKLIEPVWHASCAICSLSDNCGCTFLYQLRIAFSTTYYTRYTFRWITRIELCVLLWAWCYWC